MREDDEDASLPLAAAAHELKNALAPLALRLARFEMAAKAGRVAPLEDVRAARAEVRRLAALVNELMDDARWREGADSLAHDEVDLGALLTELGAATATAWEGRRTLFLSPVPCTFARGDAGRLRAVVENFLDNADKFAPPGSPVELGLSRGTSAVRVTVRDHGPGLPREERAKLFTRFYRAPGTAKTTRGFGLGLYLCREIAHAHGGEVGVDSAPGGGATFWLELPSDQEG